MLEDWYKEKRSILDFRRGPLGPYFDGFSDYLKERGYTVAYGKKLLGTCCQFNAFLIEQGVTRCSKLSETMTEPFIQAFVAFAPTTHAWFLPLYGAEIHLWQGRGGHGGQSCRKLACG